MIEFNKIFKRQDIIESIYNAINFSENSYSIEGIFLNHETIDIKDYAFEILIISIQKEKFEISKYIIDTIGSVNNIGVNKNNYKTLVNNPKGLEFLKIELFKDSVSNF
tara:strand:- start:1917 stop:2240 length:324 start_codon:yes stop_codon:yes gene_type:complete